MYKILKQTGYRSKAFPNCNYFMIELSISLMNLYIIFTISNGMNKFLENFLQFHENITHKPFTEKFCINLKL